MASIDFDKLIIQLAPFGLRKPKLLAFLYVLIAPLKSVYIAFESWEGSKRYDIKYQSGQVAHLEKVLNDIFDTSAKRIQVTAGEYETPLYIYLPAEERPLYLPATGDDPIYIQQRNGNVSVGIDFFVRIPESIQDDIDEYRLIAVVNRYKRASKNFQLTYYV